MSRENKKVILMSAGSLVGYNIISCLENRRRNLSIVATNTIANEPSLYNCDTIYLVPPTKKDFEKFQNVFLKIIGKEKPSLIVPCRDDDVLALAKMKEKIISTTRTSCLCGPLSIAQTIVQKEKTYEFACTHGLPFAATLSLPASLSELFSFADKHGFPLVVKPKRGFGSKGVSLLTDRSQIAGLHGLSDSVVQEFIGDSSKIHKFKADIKSKGFPLFNSFESARYSIQIFISKDGKVIGTFATEHTMLMGRSQKLWLAENSALEQLAIQCGEVFAQQGWRGPLNLNCQKGLDGKIVVFEFNGRFTGATHARLLLGYDEVSIALQNFASIIIQTSGRDQIKEVIRYPTAKAIQTTYIEELKQHGVWRSNQRYM